MAVIPAVNREIYMSNKSYAVKRFDYAVASAVSFRKSLAEQLAKAKKMRKQILAIAKQLCKTEHEATTLSFDIDSVRPTVYLTMINLDSFKDDRLVSRLWYLSNLDGARESKTCDYPASLNRDYRFDMGDFQVLISAYVRGDSATCRKIVVGSKTEVVNEYKIVCD
jgi:hypothetical protein